MPVSSGQLLDLPPAQRLATLRSDPHAADTLARLCESVKQLVLTDLERSLEMSESIADLAESLGEPRGLSRALAARAHVLAYANRFEESVALAERAQGVAEVAGAGFEAAAALLASVQARARLGRLPEAAAAAEEAGARFDALGEAIWAAKARVNAGVLARMQDDPEAALTHLRAARPAFAGQPIVLAQIESNAAEAMVDLNRFGEAAAAFSAALVALESAGSNRAAAIAEGNLADVLNRQGRAAEALRHFEHALRTLERESAAGDRARLQLERAEALATIGLHDDARRAGEQAVAALDAAGMAWESARARLGLGRALLALGRPADAGAMIREAAARFEGIGHATGVLRALALLVRIPVEHRGVPDLASRLGAGLAAVEGRAADTAAGLAAVAALHAELGRDEPSDAALSRAIELARGADLRPVLLDLLHTRGRLRLRRGDHASALADLATAMELVDHLRGVLPADRFRAALQGVHAPVYEDFAGTALASGTAADHAAAFQASERSRSRALLELMDRGIGLSEREAEPARAAGVAQAALFDEWRAWRDELNAIYSRLGLGARDAGAAARTWSARAAEAERRLSEIESRLAAMRGYAEAYRLPASYEEVRGSLVAGDALVAYFRVHGSLVAFVVRPDAPLSVTALGEAAAVASLLDAWDLQAGRARARGLDRPDDGGRLAAGARRALAPLHDALLRPLIPSLQDTARLVVCPWGRLHAVPFEALWDGERYAAERWTLSRTLSASLLTSLPSPVADGRPLVVAVPDEAAPGIADEGEDVAATLSGATVLRGHDATAQRFAAAAAGAPLLHVACHSTLSHESPLSARLRLADRWLTVRDLYTLNLPGSVVVLTGCATAQGHASAGDEAFGLVRGFFGAGASAVVASLWPVHDATTRRFVSDMYAAWRGGSALSAALAAAQRGMIRAGAHPAKWAPFIHFGRFDEDSRREP